jgi:hypothetical protein
MVLDRGDGHESDSYKADWALRLTIILLYLIGLRRPRAYDLPGELSSKSNSHVGTWWVVTRSQY